MDTLTLAHTGTVPHATTPATRLTPDPEDGGSRRPTRGTREAHLNRGRGLGRLPAERGPLGAYSAPPRRGDFRPCPRHAPRRGLRPYGRGLCGARRGSSGGRPIRLGPRAPQTWRPFQLARHPGPHPPGAASSAPASPATPPPAPEDRLPRRASKKRPTRHARPRPPSFPWNLRGTSPVPPPPPSPGPPRPRRGRASRGSQALSSPRSPASASGQTGAARAPTSRAGA